MSIEVVSGIQVNNENQLVLVLKSKGRGMYQHVYREASGVYWDNELGGFKSTEIKEWSCQHWFNHIVQVVKSGLGIDLKLGSDLAWSNVPCQDKEAILKQHAT